ncbi:MAG: arylesterase [Oceanipulchritudo sp.]
MSPSLKLFMLLCLLPAFASGERIVFIGDSLTAGYQLEPEEAYPQIVQRLLKARGRDVEVVNAGISGDTTAGGLRRIDWLLRQEMDTLFIALGANDALRGQPVEATRENLRGIIRKAREAHPEVRIILAGMLAPPNMGEPYREAFAALYRELAETEPVELMPFLLEGVAGEPELNLADGIHPNREGQRRIAEAVANVLDAAE